MAASKDKGRAILSYATPNPLGPYKLVTPLTPKTGAETTRTPVMPVMGGTLVNLPTPVAPTKQTTPVAPPMADKFVNVPKQQGRVVDKGMIENLDDLLAVIPNEDVRENKIGKLPGPPRVGLDKFNDELLDNGAVRNRLDKAAAIFSKDPKLQDRYNELLEVASSYEPAYARPPGGSQNAQRIAALNIYRQVNDMRRSRVPVDAIPELIRLRKEADLLDPYKGNYTAQRETFTGRYARDAIITDGTLYQIIGGDLNSLDKAGRETYLALLPGWTGTHKELRDAARSLSK